jgi:hypothetical protein
MKTEGAFVALAERRERETGDACTAMVECAEGA